MASHTPGPWVIDDRSSLDMQAGGHQAPQQLGNVIAECPTSFGGHTIRDRSTIGKPCPTVAEGDALGLQHAYLLKAAPLLLRELKNARELVRLVTVRQVISAGDAAIEAAGLNPWCINEGLASGEERISVWSIDAAIDSAEGAPSADDVIHTSDHR